MNYYYNLDKNDSLIEKLKKIEQGHKIEIFIPYTSYNLQFVPCKFISVTDRDNLMVKVKEYATGDIIDINILNLYLSI